MAEQSTPAPVVGARIRRWRPQIVRALRRLYDDPDVLAEQLLGRVGRAAATRPADLAVRDHAAEADPAWFQSSSMVGYATYVDRFAGRLADVERHLDHLEGLGVTYLHLMPLLATRPAPNDGGYAVVDYTRVDPGLGTNEDLTGLAAALHDRDMALCVDLVANHTAAEHTWAEAARAGDERYLAFYRTYPDRTEPDRWEETLPEVFGEIAPGSFTWDGTLERWVWTTFHPWQWDLDWSNPEVFAAMLEVVLHLADLGVDAIRLDAVPFLWKREGTDCQNLPEAHLIVQALRGLLAIAAPAVILKGEAIVAPHDLVPYQGVPTPGVGDLTATECDLLYHNQLMVQGWSSLAAQDGRLATLALAAMPETPDHAHWVTYVRCHDDIGWAIDDGVAAERGWSGPGHRRFLSAFYAGELDYSSAEGVHFQEDFVSGDRRTSGGTAALSGLTAARRADDPEAIADALDRIVLLHALAASYGGIPVIWMGDEIGLDDDVDFADDPDHAADNRWRHRPRMDWERAARRDDPRTVEGRLYARLADVLARRRALLALSGGGRVEVRQHDEDQVLAFVRDHPRHGRVACLASFAREPRTVDAAATGIAALGEPVDVLDGTPVEVVDGRVAVGPIRMRWVTEASR